MAFLKNSGGEDFRNLNNTDVPAPPDEEGNVPEEEAWEYTWELALGSVAEVDDAHVDRLLSAGGLRAASDDEVAEYNIVVQQRANEEAARAARESQSTGDATNAESSVEPEDATESADDASGAIDQDDES